LIISLPVEGNVTVSIPWTVADKSTTLIGQIVNTSMLEFDYSDKNVSTDIGGTDIAIQSTSGCEGNNNGKLMAIPLGGEAPYSYFWSKDYTGQTLTAGAGTYYVTVIDNIGRSAIDTAAIVENPNPMVTIGINSPLCSAITLNLLSGGGDSYLWSGRNGFTSTLQNPTIPNVTMATAGSYGSQVFFGD